MKSALEYFWDRSFILCNCQDMHVHYMAHQASNMHGSFTSCACRFSMYSINNLMSHQKFGRETCLKEGKRFSSHRCNHLLLLHIAVFFKCSAFLMLIQAYCLSPPASHMWPLFFINITHCARRLCVYRQHTCLPVKLNFTSKPISMASVFSCLLSAFTRWGR